VIELGCRGGVFTFLARAVINCRQVIEPSSAGSADQEKLRHPRLSQGREGLLSAKHMLTLRGSSHLKRASDRPYLYHRPLKLACAVA
jgi:hypothetical protein